MNQPMMIADLTFCAANGQSSVHKSIAFPLSALGSWIDELVQLVPASGLLDLLVSSNAQ
jgi:hypothetical protein